MMPTARSRGFSLLEVLISIFLFAIGLMGIASLQLKLQTGHVETHQRTQAAHLIRDFAERMNANLFNVNAYVTGTGNPLGTGDGIGADCTDPTWTIAQRDRCEFSGLLKGAAETAGGNQVGAMTGARACVEVVTALDPTPGVCTAGIYRLSLTWQGLRESAAPAQGLACGREQYGDETLRRVVSSTITIGLPRCS